jgi:hypothetical protein
MLISKWICLVTGAMLAVNVATFCADASRAGIGTNAPIMDLGEGRMQIGAVILDTRQKSLTFPALVNMTTGLVEYAIVTTRGKVHESLLRTDAEPYHIHTAMLLLGAKPSTNLESAAFFDPKRQIPGERLKVEVLFPPQIVPAVEGGKPQPIETFLAAAKSKKQIQPGEIPNWIYNGSYFSDGTFLAQREGSIVSLIADPSALVNNPRPDRQDDELWILHTPAIPPVHTPAQVKFSVLK